MKAFKYYYIPDKDNGVAGIVIEPASDLRKLQQEFDAFTFSPAGASVYQLGSYGTAMKKLNARDLTHLGFYLVCGQRFTAHL